MARFLAWNAAEWQAWHAGPGRGVYTDPRSEQFTAWQRERAQAAYDAIQAQS